MGILRYDRIGSYSTPEWLYLFARFADYSFLHQGRTTKIILSHLMTNDIVNCMPKARTIFLPCQTSPSGKLERSRQIFLLQVPLNVSNFLFRLLYEPYILQSVLIANSMRLNQNQIRLCFLFIKNKLFSCSLYRLMHVRVSQQFRIFLPHRMISRCGTLSSFTKHAT